MKNRIKNRIENAVREYDRRYAYGSRQDGKFLVNDFRALLNMSADNYDIASNALKAGFIIGLRKGKRDSRRTA